VASALGPTFSLSQVAPATVLYGTPASITLTASDSDALGSGATPGYNVSFRDVLTAGVSYVANSGSLGNPTILLNEPSGADTTLIWSNVADLEPASSETLTFSVQGLTDGGAVTCTTALCPGASYTSTATVYVSNDPRYVPQFNATSGLPIAGTQFTSQTASNTTTINALTTTLANDRPDSELERGVHDQQHIWTLTTTNNAVPGVTHDTALTEIDAYLPAGLEYLGCGNAHGSNPDGNTTDAHGTNEGSAAEYPDAPSMANATPLVSGCPQPTSTTTVQLSAGTSNPGGVANGVYTYVQWIFGTGSGDLPPTSLAPSGTYVIKYYAAVPLRENALDWGAGATAGTAPSGASDTQIANLDNNQGPDTSTLSQTGAAQVSTATSTGVYSGVLDGGAANPSTASGNDTVTIHDIAVQKSITTTGAGCSSSSASFDEGEIVCFTLNYQTGEYRYAPSDATFPAGVQLVDTLPNGLCPIDASSNYDQSAAGANHSECDLRAGVTPSQAYTSVVEDNGTSHPLNDGRSGAPAAGDFTLVWSLGQLSTNASGSVEFPALDRTHYQQYAAGAFSAAAPVLAGDTLGNFSNIAADTYATCVNGASLDLTCATAGAAAVYPAGEPGGNAPPLADALAETSSSSAAQTAALPTVTKEVGSPVAGQCTSGVTYASTAPTDYQEGDLVCFQLTVTFPAASSDKDPTVQDYLPPNSTYDAAASGADATNTVTIPATVPAGDPAASGSGGDANPVYVPSTGDGDSLTLFMGAPQAGCTTACDLFSSPGQLLVYDIGTTLTGSPTAGNDFDLTQNLMKFASFDTPDAGIGDRSEVTYTLADPNLTLRTGVEAINGTAISGGTVFDSNKDGVVVHDGDAATFRVDISNSGAIAATTPTIWDVLASGQTCAEISAISDGGTCYAAGSTGVPLGVGSATATVTHTTIVWSGSDIPLIAATGTDTETFVLTVPSTAATGDNFANTAGVAAYIGQPNTGASGDTTYVPQTSNIVTSDGGTVTAPAAAVSAAPTPPGGDVVQDPSNVLLSDPTIAKSVAPTTATIGQVVEYTLTATVPVGTTLYSGTVTDALGTSTPQLSYAAGSASASCHGGPLTGTISASGDSGTGSDGTYTFTLAASAATNTVALDFPTPLAVTPTGTAVTCTLTFTAHVNDVAANVRSALIANTAKFAYETSTGATGTGSPRSATASLTVEEPDLAIAETDNAPGATLPHQSSPGATVTYTVTVTDQNLTNVSVADDLVVTATLPSGETYVPGSASGGGVFDGASTITWTASALTTSAPLALTYQATVPATPTGSNSFENAVAATAESLPTGGRTSTTAAAADVSGYRATANDTITVPGSVVAKTALPATVAVGVDSTFTDTVTIPANTAFPDFTAVDVLPDGLSFDGFVSTSCTGGCSSDLSSITTESPTHDASTGETSIAWWLGNVAATSSTRTVVLTYTAYPSETYHGGAPVLADQALVNNVGVYWNNASGPATVSAPAPSGSSSNFGFTLASATAPATVTVLAPSLTLTKSTPVTSPTPGESFVYTITLQNASTNSSTAYLTTVTDPVPALLVVDPSSLTAGGGALAGANPDASGGTITWTLTGQSLAPGASLSLTYSATIAPSNDFSAASAGSPIANTATVNTYYAADAATATAAPARYDAYLPADMAASVTPVFPILALAAYTGSAGSATSGQANIGAPASWHLAVSDTSTAPVESVAVTDTLPPYWTYDPGSTSIVTGSAAPLTADPSISINSATHVQTLTWGGLGTLDDAQTLSVAFAATPGAGATLDAPGNVDSAIASADDATGASGIGAGVGVGGTYRAYQSPAASANDTIPAADLSIVKTHSGGFVAGQDGTYTIAVSNLGPDAAAEPITVTDPLPTGESFVSASGTSWSCANASGTVTCSFGTAPAGAAVGPIGGPIELVVAVSPSVAPGPDVVTNTAMLAGAGTDDPVSSDNASASATTISASADLDVGNTLTAPSTGLVAGNDATYTIAVSNLGPSDAIAPQVQDVLPAGETFVSAAGTGWSCANAGGTVTCTYTAAATLSSGAAALPISLVVAVGSGAVTAITNTAIACSGTIGTGTNVCSGSTDANGTPDPVAANDTSTAASSPSVSADLAIQASSAPSFVSGTGGTYTITVTNNGPADSVGTTGSPIVVSDTLPIGESYVSASGSGWACSAASQIVTCDDPSTIAAGTAAPAISLDVAVGSSVSLLGTLTDEAGVTPGQTPDPALSDNVTTDPTLIVGADLSIAGSHAGSFVAGTNGTYTLTASNAGPATAAGPITVIDTLPVAESFVSAGGSGWTCLDAAAVVTCTNASPIPTGAAAPPITLVAAVSPDATGTLDNTTVVASGTTADPALSNNSTVDPTSIDVESDLAIVESHSDPFAFSSNASYTFLVSNNGPSTSPGPVVVSDPLPAGETYVSAAGTGWVCVDAPGTPAQSTVTSTVTCTLAGSLAVNATAPPILLTVLIGAAAYPSVANIASLSAATPDPSLTNNSTSAADSPTPFATLALAKQLTGSLVGGTDASYLVAVANAGPSPAAGVEVTDDLPTGLSAVAAAGPDWDCAANSSGTVVTCDRALLAVGETSEITFTVYVDASAGSSIVNVAAVTTATETTPGTNAVSSAAAIVLAAPAAPVAPVAPVAVPLAIVPAQLPGSTVVVGDARAKLRSAKLAAPVAPVAPVAVPLAIVPAQLPGSTVVVGDARAKLRSAKLAAAKLAAAGLERAKLAAEKLAAAKAAAATLAGAETEVARLRAARAEAARTEAGRVEVAKLEAAKLEAAKLKAARLEAARTEAESVAVAKLRAARREAAEREAAKREAATRLAAKLEAAKLEAAKLEAAKIAARNSSSTRLRVRPARHHIDFAG